MDINILLYVSMILTILILMSILFGCKFNYYYQKEHFTNDNKENKDNKPKEEIKEEIKEEDNKEFKLSKEEKEYLTNISLGILNADAIKELIKNGKLTELNIDNIIKYIVSLGPTNK